MNPEVTKRFELSIHARLDELDAEDLVTQADRNPVELDQQSVGRLSRMDAMQRQAMAEAIHARRQTERRNLKAALHRLENGTFGECADCGKPIAERRLDFDPTATLCIECARG